MKTFKFITVESLAEWLYKVFISQACVYESQIQYRKSNEILTNVVQRLYANDVINQQLKEAIENYQLKITGKQRYFAFYCRKNIPMSFDAMTTSPVESVHNHMKHNTGVCSDVDWYFVHSCSLIDLFVIHPIGVGKIQR